jgi:hypothetical protein
MCGAGHVARPTALYRIFFRQKLFNVEVSGTVFALARITAYRQWQLAPIKVIFTDG